jgi:hypothetical protein
MRWVATLILLLVFTTLLLSQEKGTEKMECTPYPVYYCFPSGRPAHPLSKAQIDARQKASEQAVAKMAEHPPACTPYPWYSCPGVPGDRRTCCSGHTRARGARVVCDLQSGVHARPSPQGGPATANDIERRTKHDATGAVVRRTLVSRASQEA